MPNIKLQSSDNAIFIADLQVAKCSGTIKTMLEDCGMQDDNVVIPLPNVNSTILRLVLEWAIHHKDDPPWDETEDDKNPTPIGDWDAQFLNVEQGILFDLVVAANYLDIKGLLEVTAQTIANMIKGHSPEEIREIFQITNDFSPEEEDHILHENQWFEQS